MFRVAAFENWGNGLITLFHKPHRLAWAGSEIAITVNVDSQSPVVQFAGSFVPSQSHNFGYQQIGLYSMAANRGGREKVLP